MKPNQALGPNQRAFIDALRTSTKNRGLKQLRRNDDYCALGIACEVAGIPGKVDPENPGTYVYGAKRHMVSAPPELMQSLALQSSTGMPSNTEDHRRSIVSMSDRNVPWPEIADVLEANAEFYFTEPR